MQRGVALFSVVNPGTGQLITSQSQTQWLGEQEQRPLHLHSRSYSPERGPPIVPSVKRNVRCSLLGRQRVKVKNPIDYHDEQGERGKTGFGKSWACVEW
jgi:hypothetical protein